VKRSSLSVYVFLVGICVSIGQILMLGPLLPERVASHFGPTGVADGFLSRGAFLQVQWGITGFLAAMFFGLPALIRVIPEDAIHLPNKEYWLSPERRGQSLAYLADRLFAFGAATMALLASISQLVYETNLRGMQNIGSIPWAYVAAYLIYTAIWCLALHKRFHRPPT
jgi:uncharacterized membrane protein